MPIRPASSAAMMMSGVSLLLMKRAASEPANP